MTHILIANENAIKKLMKTQIKIVNFPIFKKDLKSNKIKHNIYSKIKEECMNNFIDKIVFLISMGILDLPENGKFIYEFKNLENCRNVNDSIPSEKIISNHILYQ